MGRKDLFYGYVAAVVSSIFWGISFVWSKGLISVGFPVFSLITFRVIIASAVLLLVFGLQKKIERIKKKDIKWFCLLAFFEPFLYFIGENYGLKYVSPSFAAIIIALIPIFTALTIHIINKTKLSVELMLGAVISVVGVFVLSFFGSSNDISIKGFMLLMLAVFSAVGYSFVLSKLIGKGYGPVSVTTWQNILAIVYYLPCAFAVDWSGGAALIWTFDTISSIVCLGVFCSALSFMMYGYAVKKLTIERASVFTNAIPCVTILVSVILAQEQLSLQKVIGVVIVVLGVILSQSKVLEKRKTIVK